jgi:hypothetical protein
VSTSTGVETVAMGFWLSERYSGPTHWVGAGTGLDIVVAGYTARTMRASEMHHKKEIYPKADERPLQQMWTF